MSVMAFLLLASSALAGWTPEFSENWDSSNVIAYSGTNSWVSGFSGDTWTTSGVGGVSALSENNTGSWGGNSGADNHLVKTDLFFSDFQIDVRFRSWDDDTVGIVFRFQDDLNFYVAFISNEAGPAIPNGEGAYVPGVRLYRVQAGAAVELAAVAGAYAQNQFHDSRVIADGNQLEYYVDLNRNGSYSIAERLISVTDGTWSQGNIGLYSYTNGDPNGTDFDDLVVSIWDEDDDGWADIYDNCTAVFNPSQDNYDNDAFGDACDLDADGDGFEAVADGDCDDLNPAWNPNATEYCDGNDEDCSGVADDNAADALNWYADSDGDGFGDPYDVDLACDQPSGFVANDGDCDPADPDIYTGAPELCNGVDDDCDGVADNDPTDGQIWYADSDGDGEGSQVVSQAACAQPSGYVANNLDCDDADAYINTSGIEMCDGVDNDCDDETDESDAIDAVEWFFDADLDGFGDPYTSIFACAQPSGWVGVGTDCDDEQVLSSPALPESCDGLDNDCDGLVDESDAIDQDTFYLDYDLDGFGDADFPALACDLPTGHVVDDSDCDDANDAINPDADELCATPEDDDCDGVINEDDAADVAIWCQDADGDAYGDCAAAQVASCLPPMGFVADDTDCNDDALLINPGALEQCTGVDENCNGYIDDGVQFVDWYPDLDGDGYGDPYGVPVNDCVAPPATAANDTDCDDGRGDVFPGAPEFCDGLDNDCDGLVDNDAVNPLDWYPDLDGDGFGEDVPAISACDAPADHVEVAGDCDDGDDEVNPDGVEICNDIDDNCDGAVDEGLPLETWYLDADGDGFGDLDSPIEACGQPADAVDNAGDCDDGDDRVNPDGEEIAGNGIDEDCDGEDTPDEGGRNWDGGSANDPAKGGGPSGCDCGTTAGTGGWPAFFALFLLIARRRSS